MPKPKLDIGIFYGTGPPILVPISERAKVNMDLAQGVGGVIVLGNADEVLSVFPPDYIFGQTHVAPDYVAIERLATLH